MPEPRAGPIVPAPTRYCGGCGQQLRTAGRCPTTWCARADRGWSVVLAAGVYQGELRRSVLRYKDGSERWRAGVLARLLAGYVSAHATWFEELDLVVTVPAYLGPGGRRAWDPLRVIAEQLAPLLGDGWEIRTDVVTKRFETPALRGRNRVGRQRAAATDLRAALAVTDPAAVRGRRVLVLDDVFAEGSTLREVAGILRDAGAEDVVGLVVARPPWRAGAATGLGHQPAG